MKIRERILAGEMPSVIAFELLNDGLLWHEAADRFVTEFPEGEVIISHLRKLCSGMYNKNRGNVETLDFLILSELQNSGLPVRVPPEPRDVTGS